MAEIETELETRRRQFPQLVGENYDKSCALLKKMREVAWAFDEVGYPKSETVEVSSLHN
jgi:hypothetical protein